MTPRSEVARFAKIMEEQLVANDDKGGWDTESPMWLLSRLQEEMGELVRAIIAHSNRARGWAHAMNKAEIEEVAREAADVANFAMMIADVCGGLPAKGEV